MPKTLYYYDEGALSGLLTLQGNPEPKRERGTTGPLSFRGFGDYGASRASRAQGSAGSGFIGCRKKGIKVPKTDQDCSLDP